MTEGIFRGERLLLAAVALWLTGLAGCLEIKTTLTADGSATIEMTVRELDEASDRRIREQLKSPAVKIVRADYSNRRGTYTIVVSDVRKLRTAPYFSHLRIEHDPAGSRRTLDVKIPRRPRGEAESQRPDENYVIIDLSIAFPGTLVETNGEKVNDHTAAWKVPVADMLGTGSVSMTATYEAQAEAR